MKNEEYRKEHKKKNDNSAVNFEYGDSEKDNVLPKNEKKKTLISKKMGRSGRGGGNGGKVVDGRIGCVKIEKV